MNYKLDALNQKKTERRRTRQQKSRNSPSSKLLTAAWPTAPSTPTRQSQIKTVKRDDFTSSWNEWRQQTSGEGAYSIEAMEVDVDTDDDAKVKKPITRGVPSTSNVAENRQTLRAKRATDITSSTTTAGSCSQISPRRSTRSSQKTDKTESTDVGVQPSVICATKITPSPAVKKSTQTALFIIIHVNKVVIGNISGRATTPVKVYADKFMIQMENVATKKDLSVRIPCKHILSLQISLSEKPFELKFTTKDIQYISGGPPSSRKSKGGHIDTETITLHLAYEESVPDDVKEDLKELVRLAEQNLWPKDKVLLEEKLKLADEKTKEIESEINTDKQKKTVTEEKTAEKVVENDVPTRQTRQSISSAVLLGRKRTPSIKGSKVRTSRMTSFRYLLDSVKVQETAEAKEEIVDPSINQAKFARRINSEESEATEQRIKTLEHEAAHYQMLSAQQRMIIQSLETDVQQKTQDVERQCEQLLKERTAIQQTQLEESDLQNQLKEERDLVRNLENQLEVTRNELHEKERQINENSTALDVRDDTIQQLRSDLSNRRRSSVSEKNNTESEKNPSVSQAAMEETRQHLMQMQVMQVSKESLTVELNQTRENLAKKTSDFDTLRIQLQHAQNDLNNKNESLLLLRSDFIRTQEDLVQKNEQIRRLVEQLNGPRRLSTDETDDLKNELTTVKNQLGQCRSELEDTQRRLTENEELMSQRKDTTLDWILERGEITLTDQVIGVGAWGNVKVGKFRGTKVAVKQIHLLILSPHNRRLFEREMAIASRCRHPCLVQFIGATNDDGTPLFIMELLETDLRSLLSKQPLENSDCLQLGFDVIRAINYLHLSRPVPIIHRDISSSNILLYRGKNTWRAKLSDYGAANFMRLSMTRHPGALLYSAPEASTMDQTTKLDVYSFGVLFCEMCTRELPVPENRQEQVSMISKSDYKTLVNNCIRLDVSKRLDSKDILLVFERWIEEVQRGEERN